MAHILTICGVPWAGSVILSCWMFPWESDVLNAGAMDFAGCTSDVRLVLLDTIKIYVHYIIISKYWICIHIVNNRILHNYLQYSVKRKDKFTSCGHGCLGTGGNQSHILKATALHWYWNLYLFYSTTSGHRYYLFCLWGLNLYWSLLHLKNTMH